MKDLVKRQTKPVNDNISIYKINPLSERLLWIQLLGGALFPVESLIILIMQTGVDSGPLPGLEGLLIWATGVLSPAILLWRLPLDCWSLLILKIPTKSRSPQQKAISSIPRPLWLRLLQIGVTIPLLLLIEELNQIGSEIVVPSILQGSSQILRLSVTIFLLISMMCHWHQFIQAAWLMLTGYRYDYAIDSTKIDWIKESTSLNTLSLGLPLLLTKPLNIFTSENNSSQS